MSIHVLNTLNPQSAIRNPKSHMSSSLKTHNTIGCCGIDCGLCPRFHTKGDSVCPGSGGLNFKEKHPTCGFLTCCVIKNGLEVCSDCRDYPCSRFEPERKGYDSFVSHKKVFTNLDFIKSGGIDNFLEMQKIRMNILADFLADYDEGRSKNFFCISCALLPLDKLQDAHSYSINLTRSMEIKERNKLLRDNLQVMAENTKIELKLNHKK